MSTKKNLKFFGKNEDNIEQYYVGDFIIFKHNNISCVGCIVNMVTYDFETESYMDNIMVNYLTENGIPGSIPVSEISLLTKVVGIKMRNTLKELEKPTKPIDAIPQLTREIFKSETIEN